MALNLAVSQLQMDKAWGAGLLKDIADTLQVTNNETLDVSEIQNLFQHFTQYYEQMSDTTVALAMLAKLLAHTPDNPTDKQSWKTLIADFESRFLTEKQQVAYDFMHQGISAEEAMKLADSYLAENE